MATVQEALSAAARYLREGQLAHAEELCRWVLAREPAHADALHLFGLVAFRLGRREAAVELLRQAATVRSDWHEIHSNLGLALMSLGRFDEAIAACHRAIALRPLAATYTTLAQALTGKGRFGEAVAAHRQALALKPDDAGGQFNLANSLQNDGRLDEAIVAYRQAIWLNPLFVEAHSNLANALRSAGQLDAAIDSYRHAIALRPNIAGSFYNLAIALQDKGEVEASIAAYRQAITLEPRFFQAQCNLGNLLKEQGLTDDAIAAYRQAITSKSDYAEAYSSLGVALQEQGALDEAISAHRHAVTLKPDLPEAHNNLGRALKTKGQLDDALAEYRYAIALKPDYAEAHYNLGIALQEKGQLDMAVASYGRALTIRPNYIEAYGNLGNVLDDKGDFDQAIAAYNKAISIKPDYADAHSNLGTVLQSLGRYDEAIAGFRRAVSFQPNYAKGHFHLGIGLLLRGEFLEGWPEYEWRWKVVKRRPTFTEPLWTGEELNGRTILLHAEQGFGDTIQFARYAPLVSIRGGRVILECQPELHRLLDRIPGVWKVVARGQALPKFDLQCPLLSLPRVFGTSLETIIAPTSYLAADPDLIESWNQRLAGVAGRKVGLVWAGSAGHANDKHRSMTLAHLARLSGIEGINFHSLQIGPAAAQALAHCSPFPLTDFGCELTDFAETAALIANLDLVISVDTAVAHLAAALGKPVWLLLPFVPDWRWLLEREDSPWYPTMRLFRQKAIGRWDDVIERVAESLASLTGR